MIEGYRASAKMSQWDTANVYSNGVSEDIIGKAIKKYNLPRHKLVILTKLFAFVGEEPSIKASGIESELARSRDYVNQHGTAPSSSDCQLQASHVLLLTHLLVLRIEDLLACSFT